MERMQLDGKAIVVPRRKMNHMYEFGEDQRCLILQNKSTQPCSIPLNDFLCIPTKDPHRFYELNGTRDITVRPPRQIFPSAYFLGKSGC